MRAFQNPGRAQASLPPLPCFAIPENGSGSRLRPLTCTSQAAPRGSGPGLCRQPPNHPASFCPPCTAILQVQPEESWEVQVRPCLPCSEPSMAACSLGTRAKVPTRGCAAPSPASLTPSPSSSLRPHLVPSVAAKLPGTHQPHSPSGPGRCPCSSHFLESSSPVSPATSGLAYMPPPL